VDTLHTPGLLLWNLFRGGSACTWRIQRQSTFPPRRDCTMKPTTRPTASNMSQLDNLCTIAVLKTRHKFRESIFRIVKRPASDFLYQEGSQCMPIRQLRQSRCWTFQQRTRSTRGTKLPLQTSCMFPIDTTRIAESQGHRRRCPWDRGNNSQNCRRRFAYIQARRK
jgi:hypothetical protein